jgi:hypothetical protein
MVPMTEVKIREVPEQLVVTEQRNVNQAELVEWLPGAMARVAQSANGLGGVAQTTSMPWLLRDQSPEAGVFIVIYEGNPNEGPVPVEVCAAIALDRGVSPDVATRRVPAHREAYVRLTKDDTDPMSKIGTAYLTVEQWIGAQGLEIVAAPREVYYTDYYAAAPSDDVFDVAFPVR